MDANLRTETVILAAGKMPAKAGEGERLLRAARRVVACDSAALNFWRRFHRWPEVVIGDLDSVSTRVGGKVICDTDDSINDLTKAIRYCRNQGWNDLVIVGATGLRDDHTIGNIYRALDEGVMIVTEYGVFHPFNRKFSCYAPHNTGVSIFAPNSGTRMTSQGLMYALKGVKFEKPWSATLNRVDSSERVTIHTNKPSFVFIEHSSAMKRVILSLGSNLDTPKLSRSAALGSARDEIAKVAQIVDVSEIIETEPVGVPVEYKQLKFLNQVLLVDTALKPRKLLAAMQQIEQRLGRVRTVRNGPRTIDIDIIDYAGMKLKTKDLILPHPRAKKRAFVMDPLRSLGVTSLGRGV